MRHTAFAPRTVILAALLLASAYTAAAAGIDCLLAKTRSEHAICESTTLMKLDLQLSGAYRNAIATNPADKAIRRSQRAWPGERNRLCVKDETCLVGAHEIRIAQLKLRADMNSAVDGV